MIRDAMRGAVSRLAAWSHDGTAERSAVDLLIGRAVSPELIGSLENPSGYVKFLRDSWLHLGMPCEDIGVAPAATNPAEIRFDTLIETLRSGVPPLAARTALSLAGSFDSLSARREAFDRPRYATDVAQHAVIASSQAEKGRLLAAIVRFTRARHVVDIGTAYGMSALYLCSELPDDGRVVTIEVSEPQLTVSKQLLQDEPRVSQLAGPSQDQAGAVGQLLSTVDFVCHDGAHSRAAYVADFNAYLPLMPAGAVWFLDDIRWHDPRVSDDADTYAGWRQIAGHPRVRRALELSGQYGLLQLR